MAASSRFRATILAGRFECRDGGTATKRLGVFCALALLATPAHAGRVAEVVVDRDGSVYRVGIDAEIDLPRDAVFAVVTDFARVDRLSPSIVAVEVLSDTPETAELAVVLNICPEWLRWLPMVCADFPQRQSMALEAPRRLAMRLADEDPNLFTGSATWSFSPCEGAEACTAVRFDSDMTPRIALPHTLVGWIIERILRAEALEMLRGIERVGEGREIASA